MQLHELDFDERHAARVQRSSGEFVEVWRNLTNNGEQTGTYNLFLTTEPEFTLELGMGILSSYRNLCPLMAQAILYHLLSVTPEVSGEGRDP
jgi:hypothetical protein